MKSENTSHTSPTDIYLSRIVVKFNDAFQLPYQNEEAAEEYLIKHKILPWHKLGEIYKGIKISSHFTSVEPERIKQMVDNAKKLSPNYNPPNFLSFCVIDYPEKDESDKHSLLSELEKYESVEYAYLDGDAVSPPAVAVNPRQDIGKQTYLNASPEGINAKYAWKKKGGLGENVHFIDIEQGWFLDHEDLSDEEGNPIARCLWGKNKEFHQHGSSSLGVVMMQDNDKGGKGIAPAVKTNVVSQISPSGHQTIHNAIIFAIDNLRFGDVLLLEAQVTDINAPSGNWPPEVKPGIFHAIELAVASGIIVIEPAGNGSTNLNDFTDWYDKNIFGREKPGFRDSGAIMVAACSDSPDHGKIQISNFGDRVDCFAPGENIYTTGLVVHQPDNEINDYVNDFKDTSGASAIIAGAAILIQSINKERGNPRLSPQDMRRIMADPNNGTRSGNNIGVMPDLKIIINNILASGS